MQYITISGSYRKFPEEVAAASNTFRALGVNVLSPRSTTILSSVEGFVSLQGDAIPRLDAISQNDLALAMRLIENSHLQAIQQSNALWLTIPDGYCGPATSFEIGWALAHNVPVFYDTKYRPAVTEPIVRAYAHATPGIENLVSHFDTMPFVDPITSRYFMKSLLHQNHETLPLRSFSFNAQVAVGPVIVDYSDKPYRSGQPRDILLVKTHKWSGKFSIVGGRVHKHESLAAAFPRVVAQQTGLEGSIAKDICAFDEIPDSGYYEPETSRLFVDKVVKVTSRKIKLDDKAQEGVWLPPDAALRDLELEPNARRTIELYAQNPYC